MRLVNLGDKIINVDELKAVYIENGYIYVLVGQHKFSFFDLEPHKFIKEFCKCIQENYQNKA